MQLLENCFRMCCYWKIIKFRLVRETLCQHGLFAQNSIPIAFHSKTASIYFPYA